MEKGQFYSASTGTFSISTNTPPKSPVSSVSGFSFTILSTLCDSL